MKKSSKEDKEGKDQKHICRNDVIKAKKGENSN